MSAASSAHETTDNNQQGSGPMTEPKAPDAPAPETPKITAYKGFNRDLTCRDFQYEIGATYQHAGKVVRCAEGGFHACENPLDVFNYYAPGESRFCEVEMSGQIARDDEDSKIASGSIAIKFELSLGDFVHKAVAQAVSWITSRATAGGEHVTGDSSAASATGDSSAASATGKFAVAMACGVDGKAQAAEGCAIFLLYRDPYTGEIKHTFSGIGGRGDVKPLVWYTLNESGELIEAGPVSSQP